MDILTLINKYFNKPIDCSIDDINLDTDNDMCNIFTQCTSLQNIDIDYNKAHSFIFLDTMNINQILWCEKKKLIEELPRQVAKTLNVCSLYVIIPPELQDEFNTINND